METIYIVRHGFRLNWVTNTWKSETGLARDPPLAAFGLTQADETAAYFASLPPEERPTVIFSSPYYRCLQTIRPTSEALNVPIFIEHGLSEWYSPVEPGTGLHPRPGSPASLQKYFPTISTAWSPLLYPSRRGEEVEVIHERTTTLLDALVPLAAAQGHKRMVLVTHAATAIALVRSLLHDSQFPIRVGCCAISELRSVNPQGNGLTPGGGMGDWNAVKLADGAHLEQGASRDWGFEDIEIAHGKVVNDHGEPGTENDVDDPVGLQTQLLVSSL